MYYVYQYLREDGTPYYIGKGKGGRAWSTQRNIHRPPCNSRINIIQNNLTEQEAVDLEKSLIGKYGRKDIGTGILRNMTDGGEGTSGRIVTYKTKEKISLSNKGKPSWRKGKPISDEHKNALIKANLGNAYCLGRKRPKEEIEKIASANRGRKHTEKAREKMSQSHLGKKDSEETKIKKSIAAKKPKSEEHRKNMAEAKKGEKNPMYGKVSPNRGKTLSDDTKEKIRAARSKQVISDETKLKMAVAQRRRHAAKKQNNF